jgi:hypothetical protein
VTAAEGFTAEPEQCELCGVLIADGTQVYALVADRAGDTRPAQPLAEQRLLTACTADHLDQLRRRHPPR